MRSTITALSSVSLLVYLVSAAACGGATASVDDAGDDAGSGSQGDSGMAKQGDGGTLGDGNGTLGAGCPASAPAVGATCANPNLTCEYGGAGPHLRCSTIFHCQHQSSGANTWTGNPPGPDCVGTQGQNAGACPASFSALASASACPLPSPGGGTCVYPEGLCECAPCAKADGGGADNLWSCKAWPVAPPPCPTPRPRAGSACTMEGELCSYGAVCTAVGFDQPDLKCVMGLWTDEPVAQPPCAFPQCGQ